MELHDLVALRNQLEPLSAGSARIFADREISKIIHWVKEAKIYCANADEVLDEVSQLKDHFDAVDKKFTELKQNLNNTIAVSERRYYEESFTNYKLTANKEYAIDVTEHKRLKISEEDRTLFETRVAQYSQWTYPGMIIRPGLESFIDLLVSFQPLYLVDHNKELLEPAVTKFNDIFKQRLRQYLVSDFDSKPAYHNLPDGQFGFILAYGYFNFRPIEVIGEHMEQLHAKLKPGGTLAFTFNNCDWPEAIKMSASSACSYVPGRALRKMLMSLGFEISFEHTTQGAATWMEVKKSGTLTSLKAAPTLAKIVDITT